VFALLRQGGLRNDSNLDSVKGNGASSGGLERLKPWQRSEACLKCAGV